VNAFQTTRRGRGLVATTLLALLALLSLLALAWAPPASAAPTQRLAVLELSGAFERQALIGPIRG
jgi:hypothetical protein